MLRFRTLIGRLGALYAFVIAILLGVCAVVIVHLGHMRVDSERVMEEIREQTVSTRIATEIASVETLLGRSRALGPAEHRRARDLLRSSREGLEDLAGLPGDPSRQEHQRVEGRLGDRLHGDLTRLEEMIEEAARGVRAAEVTERIASAKHHVEVLLAEAREEAAVANDDLEGRARTTSLVMLVVLLTASLLLGLALFVAHRSVVVPLRALRAGADRFGRGELGHRIRVRSTDEIGDLAASFNVMADRLADAQEHLEERVRSRTREFLRAARLADLGLLASGIAHEINTPLASIASCSEGLKRRLEGPTVSTDLVGDYLDTIRREAYRAREITTRTLALVRQEPSTLSRIPLQLVVERAEAALQHRARRAGVILEREGPAGDPSLNVNPGELVQIVVNLLANAIDASEEGDRVVLRARVEGASVVLEVEDEGVGIPADDLDGIFDPFYTTKRPGEGTGLGLALVSTMAESHGGRVAVRSSPGEGSLFRVILPIDWSSPS